MRQIISCLLLLCYCTFLTTTISAEEASATPDIAEILMKHVTDGKEWHPLPFLGPLHLKNITFNNITIPFTQHTLMMLIVMVILLAVFIPAFIKRKIVPGTSASILEPIIFFVRDTLVFPAMGRELGERWLPFFLTLFFFLLTANIIGLVPMFSTLTGNLSITLALAIIILVSIFIQGMAKNGFWGFFKNMIPKGLPLPIALFVLILEFVGIFIRISVLAVRLFANMIAGHLVIGSLLLLIFIIHPFAALISVPMAILINLMEVLVAIIQAVVFIMLSAIFIGMASNQH